MPKGNQKAPPKGAKKNLPPPKSGKQLPAPVKGGKKR